MFGKGKPKKQYDDDDGRVISSMNVEGMPWHSKQPPLYPGREDEGKRQEPPLTKKETFRMMLNATLAALLIGALFIGGAFLFILFCVHVWLR